MKVRKNGDTIFPYKPSKFPYQTSEQSETMTGEVMYNYTCQIR